MNSQTKRLHKRSFKKTTLTYKAMLLKRGFSVSEIKKIFKLLSLGIDNAEMIVRSERCLKKKKS